MPFMTTAKHCINNSFWALFFAAGTYFAFAFEILQVNPFTFEFMYYRFNYIIFGFGVFTISCSTLLFIWFAVKICRRKDI